jgi:predicted nucleic acid-binding protein
LDEPVIIADAGPLIALAKLDRLDLLSVFFQEILVPEAVAKECLTDPSRKDTQRFQETIGHDAFRVVKVSESGRLRAIRRLLDPGEAQALVLAEKLRAPVLMDERRGRIESQRMGVRVIGTGALLVAAKRRGLLAEIGPLLAFLVQNGYRISDRLQLALLEMSGEA